MSLDQDTRAISAFTGWDDLLHSVVNHDYVPTIHPESSAHTRVRHALASQGHRVHPPAKVRVEKLTPTQMFWLCDYLNCSSSSSDQRTLAEVKAVTSTASTVTMTANLAEDAVEWLHGTLLDHLDMQEFAHDTSNQIAFAQRSIERSFDSLDTKIMKALKRAG